MAQALPPAHSQRRTTPTPRHASRPPPPRATRPAPAATSSIVRAAISPTGDSYSRHGAPPSRASSNRMKLAAIAACIDPWAARRKVAAMRHVILAAAAALLASSASAQPIDSRVKARIDRILKATPLIDGHNDLPWALREDFKSSVEGLQSGTAGAHPAADDRHGPPSRGTCRRPVLVGLYQRHVRRRRSDPR